MNKVHALIIEKYPILKPTEKKVAKYILDHQDSIVLLSLKGLADLCKTSDNTVLRLCRQCGFSGYQDFKSTLVKDLLTQEHKIQELDVKDTNTFEGIKQILYTNLIGGIEQSYYYVSEDTIIHTATKIAHASQVLIIGLAGSFGVGQIFSEELHLFGIKNQVVADRIQMELSSMSLSKHDVCMGITNTGETPEVLDTLRKAYESRCFTVALSNNKEILKYKFIDVALFTHVPFKNITGPYFGAARIAQIAILELILRELNRVIPRS